MSALLGAMLLSVSSCEKILSTSSTITMTEDEHTWDSSDTVYSVMGMIAKMQKLADRAVLFGELRGDLVALNQNADESLRQLSSFEAGIDNKYNNPVDYYALINNCNYYLANVDTTYQKNGENIFKKEYGVVLAYRAWAYIQLALAYGKVPFVVEPITDGANADPDSYPQLGIRELAVKLIPDLLPYAGLNEIPQWGTVSESFNSKNLFIPNDLILADLLLWAGGKYSGDPQTDYETAAILLINYILNDPSTSKSVGVSRIWWQDNQYLKYDDSYSASVSFGTDNAQVITYIPMHKNEYDGTISELPDIFCSTENNHNRYKATASNALLEIAARQKFCCATVNTSVQEVEPYLMDPEIKSKMTEKGDLRVAAILESSTETDPDKLSLSYSSDVQKLVKINPELICLYRTDLVYLRLCEALNRAGYPELAFMILKYGICDANTTNRYPEDPKKYDPYTSYLSDGEYYSEMCDIIYLATPTNFIELSYNLKTGELRNQNCNTIGIHSRGCGDSRYNEEYVILKADTTSARYLAMDEAKRAEYVDSVKRVQMAQVEDYLVDELALETCFEGNRFGDLVRFSMHRGDDKGCETDNEFLAEKVAARDNSLKAKLLGDGQNYNPAWYLPLD